MSLAQRFAALTLAAASVVAPVTSWGQQKTEVKKEPTQVAQNFNMTGKVATAATINPASINPSENTPTAIREGADYSTTHRVASIIVASGQKDSAINPNTGKPVTGQDVADIFAAKLAKDPFNTPSKTFVFEGGDHTAIVFAVKGHLIGPFGIKDALSAMGAVSHNLEVMWAGEEEPKTIPNITGKPEPSGNH